MYVTPVLTLKASQSAYTVYACFVFRALLAQFHYRTWPLRRSQHSQHSYRTLHTISSLGHSEKQTSLHSSGEMVWGTAPQDGRFRVRIPVWYFFKLPVSSARIQLALGAPSASNRHEHQEFPWGTLRPGRKAELCCPSCAECQSKDGSPTPPRSSRLYLLHCIIWSHTCNTSCWCTCHSLGQSRVSVLIIKPTRCTNFSQIYFWNKILHVSDSSSGHHQQFFPVHTSMVYVLASRIRTEDPDPTRKQSANLYDIYHWCVYSEKLLMMDRGTVRNI